MPTESVEKTAKYGQVAEEAGFANMWLSTSAPHMRETLMVICGIASQTKKIGVGLIATSPYERHPSTLAAEMLTINDVFPERARIAIGHGVDLKLKMFGIEPKHSVKNLREIIDVVKQLSSGQPVTYDGKFAKVNALKFPWAKPFPVYSAANSPISLRMSGEVADGTMLAYLTPEYARYAGEEMWGAAAKAGRDRKDVELLVQPVFVMRKDSDEALRVAKGVEPKGDGIRPTPKAYLFYISSAMFSSKESRALERLGLDRDEVEAVTTVRDTMDIDVLMNGQGDLDKLNALVDPALEDKICRNVAVVGNPEECIQKIKEYEKAGVSEVTLGLPGPGDKLEVIREAVAAVKNDVMPHFDSD
ncbi:MAG: LLM class flavin-dependent oxidoreductase [Nitrososphaerales archaeon]